MKRTFGAQTGSIPLSYLDDDYDQLIQEEYDALVTYGAGTVYTDATISAALSAIGANKANLVIRAGTWAISNDLTIPANVNLRPLNGALVTVASGKTLTINGTVHAGPYRWIYGAGTTTIATYPQNQIWWGNAERFDVTGIKVNGYVMSALAQALIAETTQAGAQSIIGVAALPATYYVSKYASLAAALTAIGSTAATLVIDVATTLTANATIPATLGLSIPKGGSIIKASTYTLTINGQFQAGLYQVFSGFASGNVTFGFGSIYMALPEWWGAKGDGLWAVDSSTAINCAIQSNYNVFLSGKYRLDATILINRNKTYLTGAGMGVSQLKLYSTAIFNSAIIVANATPASIIVHIVLKDFGLLAEYPNVYKKIGITLMDASLTLIENVNTPDNSWTGTKSIFLLIAGRDTTTVRSCYVAADLPVYVTMNANSSVFQFDVFHFQDFSMQVLDPDEYSITFDSGVNISQWLVDGKSCCLCGKGGIYVNDSSTTTGTSSNITIDNLRIESGPASGTGTAGGYGIYMNFGASNPLCSNIRISNSATNDPNCNGYNIQGAAMVQLTNVTSGAGSGLDAFFFDRVGSVQINGMAVNVDAATVTFTGMTEVYAHKIPALYGAGGKSIAFGLYVMTP